MNGGVSHCQWRTEKKKGFEENVDELGLKHMECEVLVGHVRGCPLDNCTYRNGVEVRSGSKENLYEEIFDQILRLMTLLFERYNSSRFRFRWNTH